MCPRKTLEVHASRFEELCALGRLMHSQVDGGLVSLALEVLCRDVDDVEGSSGASLASELPRETAAGDLVSGIRRNSEDDPGGDLHTDPERSNAHEGSSEEDDVRMCVSRRRGAQGAAKTPAGRLDSNGFFRGARAHSNAPKTHAILAHGR